jgi:hypothetical protein
MSSRLALAVTNKQTMSQTNRTPHNSSFSIIFWFSLLLIYSSHYHPLGVLCLVTLLLLRFIWSLVLAITLWCTFAFFLCIYPALGSLSSLNLWVHCFLQIWTFLTVISSKFFYLPHPSGDSKDVVTTQYCKLLSLCPLVWIVSIFFGGGSTGVWTQGLMLFRWTP